MTTTYRTPADEGNTASRSDARTAMTDDSILEDALEITASPRAYSWSAHLDPDQHHDIHAAITWLVGVFQGEGIGPSEQHEESAAAEGALRRALEYLRPR